MSTLDDAKEYDIWSLVNAKKLASWNNIKRGYSLFNKTRKWMHANWLFL